MIADILSNEKHNPAVTELLRRGSKRNISLAFITQSYFSLPKDITRKSTHYFIMKIPNKRELKQLASHNSSDFDFNDFMNLYKNCIEKPYSFLVIDNTLAGDSSFHFRKNLMKRNIKTNHDN